MYNKANRKVYMLKHIRPLITNSVAALVHKTHVLPMLDYGDFLVNSGKLSKIDLRIDNSGWGANSSALFDIAGMRRYQKKYYVLYSNIQPIMNPIY